ncbi:MAG: hypothetical protein ACFFDF_02045 [Candidatus Odinarchaeota archaeon]
MFRVYLILGVILSLLNAGLLFIIIDHLLFYNLYIGLASATIIGLAGYSYIIRSKPDKKLGIFGKNSRFKIHIGALFAIIIIFHIFSKGISITLTGRAFTIYDYEYGGVLLNHGYFLFDLFGFFISIYISLKWLRKE